LFSERLSEDLRIKEMVESLFCKFRPIVSFK